MALSILFAGAASAQSSAEKLSVLQEKQAEKLLKLAEKILKLHEKHPGDSLLSYNPDGNYFWSDLEFENRNVMIPECDIIIAPDTLGNVAQIKMILRSWSGKLNHYIRSDGNSLEFFSYSREEYPGLKMATINEARKLSSLTFSCDDGDSPIWVSQRYREKMAKEAIIIMIAWGKESRWTGREAVMF